MEHKESREIENPQPVIVEASNVGPKTKKTLNAHLYVPGYHVGCVPRQRCHLGWKNGSENQV